VIDVHPFDPSCPWQGPRLQHGTWASLWLDRLENDPHQKNREGCKLNYLAALTHVHASLQPGFYCEVGCRHGHSLSLARCPAVGIDPDFTITMSLVAPTRLFRMTSDEFFAQSDVPTVLQRPIDLAFIDGMHLVEFALRDFINLERHTNPAGVIAIDDVLPQQMEHLTRERHTDIWTGDIYRLIPILRHYRPDLDVRVYDVELKGLALVSRLDPSSGTLPDHYSDIEGGIAEGAWTLPSIQAIRDTLGPQPAESLVADLQVIAKRRPHAEALS
jgi:hypothetical protein